MADKLSDMFARASSSLWTYLSADPTGDRSEVIEGDIIFSKNNICVHTQDGSHLPGYLTIRVQNFIPLSLDGHTHEEHTLILTWVPNNFIESHPKSFSPTSSPSKSRSTSISSSLHHTVTSIRRSTSSVVSRRTSSAESYPYIDAEPKKSIDPDLSIGLQSLNITSSSHPSGRILEPNEGSIRILDSPLLFPLSNEVMDMFQVDLRNMKSLRLFFTSTESCIQDPEGSISTGQLVVAARDGKFKVFHFHFGGLDKLVSVLEEFQFLKQRKKLASRQNSRTSSTTSEPRTPGPSESTHIKQFSVWKAPTLKQDECHLEEGIYSELDEETFKRRILSPTGTIEEPLKLRRIVFFGGIHPNLRREVWPFLLTRFPYSSTTEERRKKVKEDRDKYEQIDRRRLNMSQEEADDFWKKVQCTVEKDAPRTDRTNPFFAGDDNENVLIMKRILLNYAFHNPTVGYTQGMSDLLAPLLIESRDESEAFWSFEGLMERTFFISSPKDSDMDSNLSLLRDLLKLMFPPFFQHLSSMPDGLELLFTHRWLLLCFKREFPEGSGLKIWEAAWSRYQTDHFHLFVCLSVIAIYGKEVIDQDMKADEILFHFSNLTLHMNGELVLKKARGLLFQFCSLPLIPCSLKTLISPSFYASSISPSSLPPSPSPLPQDMKVLPAIQCISGQSIYPISESCHCISANPTIPELLNLQPEEEETQETDWIPQQLEELDGVIFLHRPIPIHFDQELRDEVLAWKEKFSLELFQAVKKLSHSNKGHPSIMVSPLTPGSSVNSRTHSRSIDPTGAGHDLCLEPFYTPDGKVLEVTRERVTKSEMDLLLTHVSGNPLPAVPLVEPTINRILSGSINEVKSNSLSRTRQRTDSISSLKLGPIPPTSLPPERRIKGIRRLPSLVDNTEPFNGSPSPHNAVSINNILSSPKSKLPPGVHTPTVLIRNPGIDAPDSGLIVPLNPGSRCLIEVASSATKGKRALRSKAPSASSSTDKFNWNQEEERLHASTKEERPKLMLPPLISATPSKGHASSSSPAHFPPPSSQSSQFSVSSNSTSSSLGPIPNSSNNSPELTPPTKIPPQDIRTIRSSLKKEPRIRRRQKVDQPQVSVAVSTSLSQHPGDHSLLEPIRDGDDMLLEPSLPLTPSVPVAEPQQRMSITMATKDGNDREQSPVMVTGFSFSQSLRASFPNPPFVPSLNQLMKGMNYLVQSHPSQYTKGHFTGRMKESTMHSPAGFDVISDTKSKGSNESTSSSVSSGSGGSDKMAQTAQQTLSASFKRVPIPHNLDSTS